MTNVKSFVDIGRALVGAPSNQKAASVPVRSQRSEPAITANSPGARITVADAANHMSTYGGENAIDYVTDCLELIGSTASSAAWHFERDGQVMVADKTDKTPPDVEEAPGDLVNLLRRPNPWQSWDELIELTIIDYYLAGNFFWLKDGVKRDDDKPLGIYRLNPARITIIPGTNKLVERFEYRVPGRSAPVKYQPHQIIFGRRPNPHDDHLGLSVIAGAPEVYSIELAMVTSMRAYYENGTRLSGVIETDRQLSDSLFQKAKRQISTMYAGVRNAYRVPVFEAGLTWKSISSTAAEAEYRYLAPFSRDRITSMFRVPKILLGQSEGLDRASVREANRIFDNKTMRPLLNRLQNAITNGLTKPAWGVDFKIDYEYVMPVEDQLDLAQAFAALPGVTVGEIREKVGLERLGEDRTDAQGRVIDDIVLNLPGENDNRSKVKDRPLGSEGGRPPLAENTESFDEGTAAEDGMVR